MTTATATQLSIEPRFIGIPDIVHGGYTAGLMASAIGADAAEVRLRRPVPPGRPLTIVHDGADAAELRDADTVLARARRADVSVDVPASVARDEALAASASFHGHHRHPFPDCLVCGPRRPGGEGLHIFPGPVPGRRLVASAWTPTGAGALPDELVWAALDCPQLWALMTHAPAGTTDRVVTAAMSARVVRPVVAGEPHIVIGWPIARDERAWQAGAAVFGPDGELRAAGVQTAAITTWGVPLDINHNQ